MTIKYYKSSHPDVLVECIKLAEARKKLSTEFKKFRDDFGAEKAINYQGVDGIRFCGLRFNPTQDCRLWTKPDKRTDCQRPRASVTGDSKEEHAALVRRWKAGIPEGSVSFDPLYKSVGTHAGQLYFTPVLFFYHGGELFFSSTETLNDKCQEITGTEFDISKRAFEQAERHEQNN